ncbi:chemotaxis protein CheD [Clostridium sediminicola]|uniref:chemotaxis protein CheD n=1 Tax=Clostridium sediminicola TaxID=3114879 RepID=UPI0031F1DF8C
MIIIGIGEYHISNDKKDVIKTYSLGSCVAMTIYCHKRKVSGMAHIALPFYTNDRDLKERPAHFANSAIPLMLDKFCYNYGCNIKNLQIGIFGGASSIRKDDVFKIGLRNVESIKNILSSRSLPIYKQDTGGYCSRTIEMAVDTGEVKIDTQPIII